MDSEKVIRDYEDAGFICHRSSDGALLFSRPIKKRKTTDVVEILQREFVRGKPTMVFLVWWYGIALRVETAWYRLTHSRSEW